MKKLPARRFHLVFSMVMGVMMVFLMTFVVTLANIGWRADFVHAWAKAFAIAYVVAVPVIYFLAPLARRLTARWVQVP
jgi:Kef-type K+ transport system membrane component KefB